MRNILEKLNLAKHVSRHLVGDNHTEKHHKGVGIGFMAVGVLIAKWSAHYDPFIIHLVGDMVGYALHGIGLIPYISTIEKPKPPKPHITVNNQKSSDMNTAKNIVSVFENYRMQPTAIDQFNEVGREVLEQKIEKFTRTNDPVDFVMLGFPMKSMNDRDKVLGKLPDLGEQLSMENFRRFNEDIKKVYPAGAQFTLVSDGYVFNDVMEAEDKVVADYEEIAKDMSRIAPVQWYDLTDFYSKKLSMNEMREKLTKQFGITEVELERRILTDPDVNFLYAGMIRFMEQDLAIKDFVSRNQLHKAAKKLAREMMLRNEAYSGLVREEFRDSVRLSMHPSVNNGAKFSYQMIAGKPENIKHSAWHSAILVGKDGEISTVHKKDALAAGHTIVTKDGRPYFFQEN